MAVHGRGTFYPSGFSKSGGSNWFPLYRYSGTHTRAHVHTARFLLTAATLWQSFTKSIGARWDNQDGVTPISLSISPAKGSVV